MILAIWGQNGTGNSVLANALAELFAKNNVTLLINTDLTQPTLSIMLSGYNIDSTQSLGRALNIGMKDVKNYMHQHPKNKKLYYAGLTDKDNILSHEIGLEAGKYVNILMDNCTQMAEHIIIDISSQRNDPFLPYALTHVAKIIMPLVPNTKGITRHMACMELVNQMGAEEKILPIAVNVFRFHDIRKVEKLTEIKFAVALPFITEVSMCMDTGKSVMDIPKYAKQVKKLFAMLEVRK